MRKCFALLLAVTLALVLGGCGKKEETPKQGSDELLLGFAQLGSESGWRIGNTKSVTEAAERAGIRLMYSNANQSQEKQIKAIRSYIAYRVDVIAFSPIVEDGWDNVLREARDAGIPIIIEDRYIKTEDETLYAAHIGSDFYQEGVMAGEYLLRKLAMLPEDRTLNVIELEGTIDSTPMLQRRAGFRDTVKDEPRIHLLDSICGDFMISKGKECVKAMLEQYGTEIDALFSHNDCMMYGAVEAIREYGLTPGQDVIIISVDGEQQAIDLLKEGEVNCVVECTPNLGDEIMRVAKDLAAGREVQREVYSQETCFTDFDDLTGLAPRGY